MHLLQGSFGRALTVSCLLAACGSAQAQMRYRVNIPDFDQVRQPAAGIFGLPNNGLMYCVPTATINMIAYINNHGYPRFAQGRVGDWQRADYNAVTFALGQTGALMQTSPTGGTQLMPWYRGTKFILDFYYPGMFAIGARSAGGRYAPTPRELYNVLDQGGMATFCFGYYRQLGGVWVRQGGHCVTLLGVRDPGGPNTAIGFRDPATEDAATRSPFNQSRFRHAVHTLRPVAGNYRMGNRTENRTQYEIVGYRGMPGTACFIDAYVAVFPKRAFTVKPRQGIGREVDEIKIINPVALEGDPRDREVSYPLPGGLPIVDLAPLPDQSGVLVLSGPRDGEPGALWTFNPADGSFDRQFDLPDPQRLAVGRSGEAYILDGDRIVTADLDEAFDRFFVAASFEPGTPIDALTYDDARDQVVSLRSDDRTLTRFLRPVTPGGVRRTDALPDGVDLPGRPSLASGHDGSFWMTSDGADAIYRVVPDPGTGDLALAQAVRHPLIVNPKGLSVDPFGHLLFTSGGVLRQLALEGGEWDVPENAEYNDLGAELVVQAPADRGNVEDWMEGEDFDNILPPGDNEETLDCRADFNNDGFVDFLDLDAFLECFDGQICPRFMTADFDADGFVDFFDLDAFLEAFEAGCD